MSIWLFFTTSFSLLIFFMFSFLSRKFIIACWNIYTIAALKALSNNSNLFSFPVLASVIVFFSFKVRFFWFLEWWMIFFFLYPGHFGYYVMRFWIRFEFSILAGFNWCYTGGEREHASLFLDGDGSPILTQPLLVPPRYGAGGMSPYLRAGVS